MNFEEQLKQFKESLNIPKNFGVSDYNILMKEIKKIIIEKALSGKIGHCKKFCVSEETML